MKLLDLLKESILETINAGTFTVYHRTKSDPKVFNKGFTPGKGSGAMYGPGIYTTYELETQMNPDMEKEYGPYIVEFEIKNNGKFLILDPVEAKKVYGTKHSIIDQLKRIAQGKFNRFYRTHQHDLDDLVDFENTANYSSDIAIFLYKRMSIEDVVDGVIFSGRHDGKVFVLYETNLANPIRYSEDNGETWTSLKSKESHKIGRDQRTPSKHSNFLNLANRGDFNQLTNSEKQKLVDSLVYYKVDDFRDGDVLGFGDELMNVGHDKDGKPDHHVGINNLPSSEEIFNMASPDAKAKYFKDVLDVLDSGLIYFRPLSKKFFYEMPLELKKAYIKKYSDEDIRSYHHFEDYVIEWANKNGVPIKTEPSSRKVSLSPRGDSKRRIPGGASRKRP